MDTYTVDGISVDHYSPEVRNDFPPLLFVHGGTHGSWLWEKYAGFFSQHGWDCHALNWFNHGNSRKLPTEKFITRSIGDVAATEIRTVASQLDQQPIVLGHSMGGLASLAYAANTQQLSKLVLFTPVLPAVINPEPAPLPVEPDPAKPYAPPDADVARLIFYPTLSDDEVQYYSQKLVPESPQAVYEAINFALEVPIEQVNVPTFIVATSLDPLSPASANQKLASAIHADYLVLDGIGHCDLLLKESHWKTLAAQIEHWLQR